MDPILDIPRKPRPMPLWRLCLIMGLTALLLLLLTRRLDAVVLLLTGQQVV